MSGAIGLDGPTGLACKGCKDVVHVGARRKREVVVLLESDEHAARDRPVVAFAKLRALLILLPFFLPLCAGNGEATWTALLLRLGLGLRVVVGVMVALGVQILLQVVVVADI